MTGTKNEMAPPCVKWLPRRKIYVPLLCLLLFYAFFQMVFHNDSSAFQIEIKDLLFHQETTTARATTTTLRHTSKVQNIPKVNCTKKLPTCVIIGAAKCGTSALLKFLDEHPEIVTVSPYQEIQYFSNPVYFVKGSEWYRDKMPCSTPGQITMEKSPQYMWTSLAPKRMFSFNKDMKLILIACNPVKRLLSMLAQSIDILQRKQNNITSNPHIKLGGRSRPQVGGKNVTFESLAMNYKTGEVNRKWRELKKGFYGNQMKPFLEQFNRSQFHVVNGEDFLKDPLKELGKVETFLDIESWYIHQELTKRNDDFYCLNEKCLSREKGRKHPYVDPVVLDKLREYYIPYNEEFYKLMNVTFNWENEYKLAPNMSRLLFNSSANYLRVRSFK